jgi:hypothetical protein
LVLVVSAEPTAPLVAAVVFIPDGGHRVVVECPRGRVVLPRNGRPLNSSAELALKVWFAASIRLTEELGTADDP